MKRVRKEGKPATESSVAQEEAGINPTVKREQEAGRALFASLYTHREVYPGENYQHPEVYPGGNNQHPEVYQEGITYTLGYTRRE